MLYSQNSPITFANAQAVPTIILHGGTDPVVKVTQATALRDKLILFNILLYILGKENLYFIE